MSGYGENPWYMQDEFGWTPDFKDEHAWCTAALKAWPDGIPIPDKPPAVVTVLIHRHMLEYVFDDNRKIVGVRATDKLRTEAANQRLKN